MDVSDKAGTLRAQEHGHQPIVCYALKGNFIDRETQQNGIGWREGVEFTLDATDRHGVCYAVDCRNLHLNEEKSGTLQSKNQGGYSLNFINPVRFQNTGIGWWNQSDKAQTLRTPCGGDSTKANIVLMQVRNEDESISNENRSLMCEQPSGELHGAGCVQRYASDHTK